MRSEYQLVYQGQSRKGEQHRSAVVSLLREEYGLGKIFEVDELLKNPPFLLKKSDNREELESDSSKLKKIGAQTAILHTIENTQLLAQQIKRNLVDPAEAPQPAITRFQGFFANYANKINEILSKMDIHAVEELMFELLAARSRNSQIFILGNGGSAASASHLATDLAKQRFEDEKYMFRVMSLADNLPWFSATANDFGYENVFVQQLKNLLQPNDVIIAISSSGNSQNIIRAVEYGNLKGAKTFGVVGFDGGDLIHSAKRNIYIPTKKGQYGYMEDVAGILGHIISIYLYENDCLTGGKK